MPDTFIHIGMPRTATTFLQRKIFPHLTGFHFLSLPYAHFSPAFQKIQYQDDSLYSVDEIKNDLAPLFKCEKLLISNENFVGQSLFWYNGNRTRNARRLQELFPDAHIIITLRNQLDLLRSMYEINLQWKETKTLDRFVISDWEHIAVSESSNSQLLDLSRTYYHPTESYEHIEGYDYLPLLNLYKKLFRQVTVLFYEDFSGHKDKFIAMLENALGTTFSKEIHHNFHHQPKLNRGLDARQARKLQKLNRLAPLAQNNPFIAKYYYRRKRAILHTPPTNNKIDFSPEKKETLRHYFDEKNRKLQAELDIIPERLAKQYLLK